jgi:hypothetical protein
LSDAATGLIGVGEPLGDQPLDAVVAPAYSASQVILDRYRYDLVRSPWRPRTLPAPRRLADGATWLFGSSDTYVSRPNQDRIRDAQSLERIQRASAALATAFATAARKHASTVSAAFIGSCAGQLERYPAPGS